MQVSVSGRNTVVTDHVRSVAEEKIGKLDKFLPGLEMAEVHFIEERNPRITEKEVCEVTLQGHGHHVRCKVRAVDHFQAIDLAVDKLEHQLHKLKTKIKRYDKHAKRGHAIPPAGALLLEEEEVAPDELVANELGYRIVRSKNLELTRMTPAEAALQMDLVDHDFYLFRNAGPETMSLVYRREDGDIGLIETLNPVI